MSLPALRNAQILEDHWAEPFIPPGDLPPPCVACVIQRCANRRALRMSALTRTV